MGVDWNLCSSPHTRGGIGHKCWSGVFISLSVFLFSQFVFLFLFVYLYILRFLFLSSFLVLVIEFPLSSSTTLFLCRSAV